MCCLLPSDVYIHPVAYTCMCCVRLEERRQISRPVQVWVAGVCIGSVCPYACLQEALAEAWCRDSGGRAKGNLHRD